MGRANDQPLQRGATWYGGLPIPNFSGVTLTAENLPGGWNVEGKEYIFEDGASADGSTTQVGYNSGKYVTVRAVRNVSGVNILPGQICTLGTTYVDGTTVVPYGRVVSGVTNVLAAHGYPADEFLPPAGVPNGDLFYIVVGGPCLLKSAAVLAGAFVAGQKVVAATDAATTGPSAGCVVPQVITESTDTQQVLTANEIQNAIGRAMSAVSSGATGSGILVDIGWE